jgi:hypothetical protein
MEGYPTEEKFGLMSHILRAPVSVALIKRDELFDKTKILT